MPIFQPDQAAPDPAFKVYFEQVSTEMKRLQQEQAAPARLSEEQINKMITGKWQSMSTAERQPFQMIAMQQGAADTATKVIGDLNNHQTSSGFPFIGDLGNVDIKKEQPKPASRKRQTEVMPGEPLADDILPNSFPLSFGDP